MYSVESSFIVAIYVYNALINRFIGVYIFGNLKPRKPSPGNNYCSQIFFELIYDNMVAIKNAITHLKTL